MSRKAVDPRRRCTATRKNGASTWARTPPKDADAIPFTSRKRDKRRVIHSPIAHCRNRIQALRLPTPKNHRCTRNEWGVQRFFPSGDRR